MEKIVTIVEQRPLQTRNYTAQDGTEKVFHSRGFILSDGVDEFYAEMTGDMARYAPEYDRSQWHAMQAFIKQRAFTDKNGVTRFDNQIFIGRLV